MFFGLRKWALFGKFQVKVPKWCLNLNSAGVSHFWELVWGLLKSLYKYQLSQPPSTYLILNFAYGSYCQATSVRPSPGPCPLVIMQFTCFDLLQLNILLSSPIYINGSLRITSFYIIETARRPWFMMGNERHTRGITSIIISLICN